MPSKLRFIDEARVPQYIIVTDEMRAALDDIEGENFYDTQPDMIRNARIRLGEATLEALRATTPVELSKEGEN